MTRDEWELQQHSNEGLPPWRLASWRERLDSFVINVSLALLFIAALALAFYVINGLFSEPVSARDLDGRYANSPHNEWFKSLKSSGGTLCCDGADGTALNEVDWDTKDGRYRVRIEGEWVVVPKDAVINEPNRAGRTMVWPYMSSNGWAVRCFMPGVMI